MKKITKIEGNNDTTMYSRKLKVAAYCRVSTGSDEQLISLETQKAHYESYIKSNTEWRYVGLYYDEGISGTKKEKRPELLRMISDCESGQIDYIITKSISRFARNTTDCLELVRKLLDLGVAIYFEKENINTITMESELMLSILSSLAENESISISENNKWSIQKRFQNGTYIVAYPPYGYENRDGEMVIHEEQAKVVRFIFEQILAGNSTHKVAKILEEQGIPTKKGGKWTSTTIRGIVGNEKYIGDILFQKTYTDSRFCRHTNRGDVDQYYMENHHDPIVSHEVYEKAAQLINQRAKEKGVIKGSDKYTKRYPFTKKIICGECGTTFKRRIHSSGENYIAWCCKLHIEDKEKCSMQFIREDDLEKAFITMINKLVFSHKLILKPLLDSLRKSTKVDSISRINELKKLMEQNLERRQTLVTLMAKGYLESAVFNKESNELASEFDELQKQKDVLSYEKNGELSQVEEVTKLYKILRKAEMYTSFNADVFESSVEHIAVHTRSEVSFVLKCGLNLTERM